MKLTKSQITSLVNRGIITAKDINRLTGKKKCKKKGSAVSKLFRPGKKPLDTSMNIA